MPTELLKKEPFASDSAAFAFVAESTDHHDHLVEEGHEHAVATNRSEQLGGATTATGTPKALQVSEHIHSENDPPTKHKLASCTSPCSCSECSDSRNCACLSSRGKETRKLDRKKRNVSYSDDELSQIDTPTLTTP